MARARIMHIDDEADIREIVRLSLSRDAGLEVRSFATGPEGVDAVVEWHPDLFLLDFMMPKVDGVATLAMLRQAEGSAENSRRLHDRPGAAARRRVPSVARRRRRALKAIWRAYAGRHSAELLDFASRESRRMNFLFVSDVAGGEKLMPSEDSPRPSGMRRPPSDAPLYPAVNALRGRSRASGIRPPVPSLHENRG